MESTPQIIPRLREPLPGQQYGTVMYQMRNESIMWVSAGGLLVVILLGTYAGRYLILVTWRSQLKSMRLLTEFYADQDGEATADSIKKAAASARKIRRLTGVCIGLGSAVSIAKIGWSLGLQVVDWLQTVIWVSLTSV